jgi:hypothetical protein
MSPVLLLMRSPFYYVGRFTLHGMFYAVQMLAFILAFLLLVEVWQRW